MSTQATDLTVRKTVNVAVPLELAFEIFTDDFGTWWPLETHSIGKPSTGAFIEGSEGGRVYERTDKGAEADWGRVLVWEPPRRLVFTWEITKPATEVEVRFSAADAGTRVELEHRGWERLGAEARTRREEYDPGWTFVLGRYEEAAQEPR